MERGPCGYTERSVAKSRKPKPKPKLRPLVSRPGALFVCSNDGLCCTDIHALGPITRSEAKDMRAIDAESVFYNDDVEDLCLRPVEGGGCFYLDKGLCRVHAEHGPRAKPTGCQRFPFGLVATPLGGRVTTEHRCPCRTLGERPEIDLEEAEQALKDRAGRLESDQEVEGPIDLTDEHSVGFGTYLEIEARLLERLSAGEDPKAVLGADPLPDLHEGSWPVLAAEYFDMQDGSAGGEALGWFGDALLELATGHRPPARSRPWAAAFERGIARAEEPVEPRAIYNDWLADEIWMFRWHEWGPFDVGRAEMATRLAIAQKIQARLQSQGVRADQAAAEAIMMVEIATVSTEWPKAVDAIATDPSPASELSP